MKNIDKAIQLIQNGELVAIPTETVYGLAADASNPLAIRQIFATKQRPNSHPLIVHVASIEQAKKWCYWTKEADRLAKEFWPGPLTLILQKREHVLNEITGGLPSIGIRIPNHPQTLALLHRFQGAVAAPSANRFGRISPTCAEHVREEFGDRIFILDGGPCNIGVESSIVDLYAGPALLRPGAISKKDIIKCIGPLHSSNTPASGTLKAHYAPMTALLLCENPEQEAKKFRQKGKRVAILEEQSNIEYAKKLYAELRRLDKEGHDVLIAKKASGDSIGAAINDRLTRASYGSHIHNHDSTKHKNHDHDGEDV